MRKMANLRARRNSGVINNRAFGSVTEPIVEAYEKLNETESIRWLSGAMASIPADDTQRIIDQAERVKAHLDRALDVDFAYQGSVTNDTHIKYFSDIDLLVLHKAFVNVDTVANPRYLGDATQELVQLRKTSASVVRSGFPRAMVDESGNKSVKISGGSLTSDVDLVAANWWDTEGFVQKGYQFDRGVYILDMEGPKRVKNKPFLHNAFVNLRDGQVNGNLRKLARLLKSLKADADTPVQISSYDIVSIVYNMPEELIAIPTDLEPLLAKNCSSYLDRLEQEPGLRTNLWVPNGMRKVFCDGGATVTGLRQLNVELKGLIFEIEHDLRRSMRKLAEARIRVP